MMPEAPLRTTDLRKKKQRGEPIAMLTAYDAAIARLLDRAGVDAILVGDSLGMVALGYSTTVEVTLDAMVHHAAAVSRGVERALVVADMPFLSYQVNADEAVRNAGRLLQQGGAAAVKLEGGRPLVDTVRRLVDAGIPVMGHLGLLPQSVHRLGGYRRQATEPESAATLLEDARALEAAGAFAVVLEMIPPAVARAVTAALSVPTIGIGAGADCDGQVLVTNDLLGLTERPPSFARQYADLSETIARACRSYVDDVRSRRFPEVASSEPAAARS
jgi:3-methyl-2-oxobutanoate hydroxymethyltransferase